MAQTVEQWGIDDVMAFFHEISLEKYVKDIKKQKVDGKKLLMATEAKDGGIKGIKNKEDFKKIQESLTHKIRVLKVCEDDFYLEDGFAYDEFDSDDDYEKPVATDEEKEYVGAWLRRDPKEPPCTLRKPLNRDSGFEVDPNRRFSEASSVRSFSSFRESMKYNRSMSRDSAFSDRSFTPEDVVPVSSPIFRNPYHQESVTDMDWFHAHLKDRQTAESLLKDFGGGKDGIFLVRFSTRDLIIHPYTLMVVLNQSVQHIPIYVRTHKACKFALGSEKQDEKLFYSLEGLIDFHRYHEILVTGDNGKMIGTVLLKRTPPKLKHSTWK